MTTQYKISRADLITDARNLGKKLKAAIKEHSAPAKPAHKIGPSMFQWAKDYSQELMPMSLLDDVEEFLKGLADGAPYASGTDKTAIRLKTQIAVNRGKVFLQ